MKKSDPVKLPDVLGTLEILLKTPPMPKRKRAKRRAKIKSKPRKR